MAQTATPLPTATVSLLPRPSATQTAAVRLQTQATEAAESSQEITTDTTANNAVEQQTELAPSPTPQTPGSPISTLNLAQIGLGLLLIIFGGLTYFVRRRL
jgi:hypothetical protein